jgi:NADH-quinone oxidoreductase subunit M
MAQKDMKKMIAYSSVAHMGFVTAGIFSLNDAGLEGAALQMLSHGLISSGLFFAVGMLYERMHTREISDYGGVASSMPIFATFFMLLVMASIGLPGTSGFVSEFLSLVGIFKANIYMAIIATLGVVLGAIYMLRLYKDVMFGEIKKDAVHKLSDLSISEVVPLLSISLLVLYIGIFPEYVLSIFRLGLNNIL